ncbi:MAG: hypothetical protein OXR72_21640 [Gemmatimonadota bacterium]|nr:hypothetical protein [Gemmatimonadota bacterium]
MKKASSDELRPEYRRRDLGPGVRGRYFESFRSGTNLVLLEPDIATAFPTDEAVNNALRSVMERAVGPADTRKSTR